MEKHYQTLETEIGGLVKSWTEGVPFETEARLQLQRTASLPIIYKWVAAMPDVHVGIGDAVMAAQNDLVEIVHTLKQVVCVNG